MLYIFNFNLKEYKVMEYQKFIKENEKTMVEHAPKGWKYMGTYFYVLGFGPYTAAQFWEISDYADFDTFRNHEDPTWLKLMGRSIEFGTPEPTPAWLLREAGDTKITEPKKKPEVDEAIVAISTATPSFSVFSTISSLNEVQAIGYARAFTNLARRSSVCFPPEMVECFSSE